MFIRIENALICPDNVRIEDESINHALSDSEVQGTDEEHQQETCSCKEDEECQVVVGGAVYAVGRSNSQAVVLLAATTQSPSSIECALRIGFTFEVYLLISCDAKVKRTVSRVCNSTFRNIDPHISFP